MKAKLGVVAKNEKGLLAVIEVLTMHEEAAAVFVLAPVPVHVLVELRKEHRLVDVLF